jgi:hypothetical protein
METFSVERLESQAKLAPSSLPIDLTEKLRNQVASQTRLRISAEDGDLQFSGTIIRYDVKPVAIQSNEIAASNRLTITVKVKYECRKYPEDSWLRDFSQYADFSSTKNLHDIEADLVSEIIDRLAQDVINKVLSNW